MPLVRLSKRPILSPARNMARESARASERARARARVRGERERERERGERERGRGSSSSVPFCQMWTVSLEKVVSRAAPGGFNAPCNINVLARSLRLASGVYRLRAVACGVMEHHISPASKAQSCPAMPGSASRTPVRASGAACVGRKVGLGERGAREQARVAKYCACMRVRASWCMRALPKHVHAPPRACWPGWSWSTDGRRALERLAGAHRLSPRG